MPEVPSGEVTLLLEHWVKGDHRALADLVPLVHTELRRLAHSHLKQERKDHTLQSAALVNEAFLRLVAADPMAVRSRSHFIAVASRLMRQVLVDYARNRSAAKRDGGAKLPLDEALDVPVGDDEEIIAVDEALQALGQIDERQASIVEMKFFGGLSGQEIATLLGVSPATVDRDWSTARVWLRRYIRDSTGR